MNFCRFYFLSSFIVSSFIPLASYASPADELEKTRREIEERKTRQVELAAEQKKIENELADLQKQLVRSASSTQNAQEDFSVSQEKLRIFNDQLTLKEKELAAQRSKLAAMVNAALRLSQMPPEAMVVQPGEEGTVKAASALKVTSDSIRKEMEELRVQNEELKRLKRKTADRRQDLSRRQADVENERQALQKKLAERKALREKLDGHRREEAEKIAELARKAENLQALIASVSRRESARADAARGKGRSLAAAKGKLTLPVAGRVVERFGGGSKGVVVAAKAPRAPVLAPFDGEVAFAGTFLNYGKMVILKHSDEFHTLLSGLDSIDVSAGDFLLEGEPIGAMGEEESGERLYVELRKDSQPINPEPWIKELKRKKH